MTTFSPALDSALAGDVVTIFGALSITVGSNTVRLLDGSSELMIGGNLFTGEDVNYGTWAALDKFTDGTGDNAPGIVVTMLPSDENAVQSLSGPDMQGEHVKVYVGAVDNETGLIIGDAYQLFDGEVDITRYIFGTRTSEIEFECVGGMERMFFNDEGLRLVPAFHAQVWPGETGLNHVTGVIDTLYWGGYAP